MVASAMLWHVHSLARLCRVLSFHLAAAMTILRALYSVLCRSHQAPIFINLVDALVSLYLFVLCGLSPCTVDVDDQTTMHFWVASHRRSGKPNLVMVHGSAGSSRWQFVRQAGSLSQSFNLFLPDLLFFGKSHTRRSERSDVFQARCVTEGLKRLGVDRFAVYGISYGGYVGYWMAEKYPQLVEKLVIVSCGIGCEDHHKEERLRKTGCSAQQLIVPEKPQHLRSLVAVSFHKYNPIRWVPDFFLREYIHVMCREHRKEKVELVEHLLAKKGDSIIPKLTQETLIIWGDQDKVFPLDLAHQLQRMLGPKSTLEIIKDAGHAVNIESPHDLNDLIRAFILS